MRDHNSPTNDFRFRVLHNQLTHLLLECAIFKHISVIDCWKNMTPTECLGQAYKSTLILLMFLVPPGNNQSDCKLEFSGAEELKPNCASHALNILKYTITGVFEKHN